PTPLRASSGVTWLSASSCSCSSFSSSVMRLTSELTFFSIAGSAGPRVRCSAPSSLACVRASTPPPTAETAASDTATSAVVRPLGRIPSSHFMRPRRARSRLLLQPVARGPESPGPPAPLPPSGSQPGQRSALPAPEAWRLDHRELGPQPRALPLPALERERAVKHL